MAYLDQRALDEIQVTAVGSNAEFATPGVAWTGVVKSGGNDFHGLLSYDGQERRLLVRTEIAAAAGELRRAIPADVDRPGVPHAGGQRD